MNCSSTYDPIKTYTRVKDQVPTVVANALACVNGKPLKAHHRGGSLESQIMGPMIVALGHDIPGAVGIGPDRPDCMGSCCWCLCGCQPPHGSITASIKADLNRKIKPVPGKGLALP